MKDLTEYVDYREYLKDFYQLKKTSSRTFTYKKWADSAGLKSPSTLIMILNGQRHPNFETTEKIATHLKLSQKDTAYLHNLVLAQKSGKTKTHHPSRHLEAFDLKRSRLLENDSFKLISRWYGYAIRELVNLKDFNPDVTWMKNRLLWPVAKLDVRSTVNNLLNLKLWTRDRWKFYKMGFGKVRTQDDIQSYALKEYHHDTLKLAQLALDEVPVNEREISGGCFCINLEDLPSIKSELRKFQLDLCEKYGVDSGDAIYQLETCFFPLTTTGHLKDQTSTASSGGQTYD